MHKDIKDIIPHHVKYHVSIIITVKGFFAQSGTGSSLPWKTSKNNFDFFWMLGHLLDVLDHDRVVRPRGFPRVIIKI